MKRNRVAGGITNGWSGKGKKQRPDECSEKEERGTSEICLQEKGKEFVVLGVGFRFLSVKFGMVPIL